jgi:endonuclease-3 related protein
MSSGSRAEQIHAFYAALSAAWGPQHWWPAQSRLEVVIGAYLTQNTSWTNVERALANLRGARALSLTAIRQLPLAELERLVRPAGYFRQKARRLKKFIAFLDARYGGLLDRMFAQPTVKLREELLGLNGVGPETADSILLYAGNHPVFVVDAYTRRIAERHGLLPATADYEEIRALFEHALSAAFIPGSMDGSAVHGKHFPGTLQSALFGASHPPSRMSRSRRTPPVEVFNQMHALIVGVGKHHCLKSAPKCDGCPLQPFLSR